MKRLACVVALLALVAACMAVAETPTISEETLEQTTPPALTEDPPEQVEAATALTNSHGLKLDRARRAASRLKLGMLRSDVEKLLGIPDATANKTFEGHAGWERWERLEWTYTWNPPKGKLIEFIIAFDADSPWGRISHYYWQRGA